MRFLLFKKRYIAVVEMDTPYRRFTMSESFFGPGFVSRFSRSMNDLMSFVSFNFGCGRFG